MSLAAAAPASADPGNPCGLLASPLCALVPIQPNLDHDVDLTKDPNGLTDDATTAPVPGDTGTTN